MKDQKSWTEGFFIGFFSWFSYLMIAIIQFEMVMFWLGLRRPLGSETNDQIYVESDLELSRNDASIKRTLTKRVKDHSK